ncbi:polysaccharide deacetylase family protein [Pseudoalteromonas sp. S16_S37]|uniref:polysaccharide deacetylase family protein n=1 Tax=Pseudoalteromonas sp. S16_S37 TaxID=2720228 RepID=UPI0016805FB8|nr:polysaccharide deacetylase family protein [Pseudoalteromonas sp. S16_S37]MBD1581673.1 polysaccharide deacetylase family protein [Pseudoalteromonas sp. S16_S37]
MRISICFSIIIMLLSGCGSDNEKVKEHTSSEVKNTAQEEVTVTDSRSSAVTKIISSQGNPDALNISLSQFQEADFDCVSQESLPAVHSYLSVTGEVLNESLLRKRLCDVVSLYQLNNMDMLTAKRLQDIGIRRLFDANGKLNEWAFEEVKRAAPERHFDFAQLQKLVDDFHYNQANVWPKQINLSFDDGGALPSLYNHLWLFEKYDAKFTFYASFYSDLDKQKMIELVKQGHEIGHHGTRHVNAELYSTQHGLEKWFEDDVLSQLRNMKADGFNVTSFAYPYGANTLATDRALKNEFSHIRKFAAWENMEYTPERGDSVVIYGFSVDSHVLNFDSVKKAIDNLKGGETLYLASHSIGAQGDVWYITAENLEKILAYAKSKGIKFCTTSECQNFKGLEYKNTAHAASESILSVQGKKEADTLKLEDFTDAGFKCVNEQNLVAMHSYLKATKDLLTAQNLQQRFCQLSDLFKIKDKSKLSIELLSDIGIKGLDGQDQAINRWAFDELLLNSADGKFLFADLQQLVDEFHYNQANVWPKQINISFDDGGALPTLHKHLWLFEKYNVKFTFYASFYHDLNKAMMKDLAQQGHEIGHHGTRHVNAELYSAKHGLEKWLEDDVLSQLRAMKEDGFNVTTFAYPYGAHSLATDSALMKHFKHVRKFAAWENMVYTPERSDSAIIYGFSVDSHVLNFDSVKKAIDNLKGGETLYLASHAIGAQGDVWYITAENLEAILAYATQKGLKFCHTSECMNFKQATTE